MSETKAPVQISIQRGLTILKSIKKRVEGQIPTFVAATLLSKDKKIQGLYTKDQFTENNLKVKQSLEDMLKEREMIKAAIYASNSTTNVKVAGKEYTVASAIAKKENLPFLKKFYANIETQIRQQKAAWETEQETLRKAAEDMANKQLGGAAKANAEEAGKIITQYLENNSRELILTISEDELKKIQGEIREFEEDVDVALSESNAITKITLS